VRNLFRRRGSAIKFARRFSISASREFPIGEANPIGAAFMEIGIGRREVRDSS
jgi:hypothetical protein